MQHVYNFMHSYYSKLNVFKSNAKISIALLPKIIGAFDDKKLKLRK